MRNTRKSGQILRSKKHPRRTLRSGRGSRTNSNTSHQIPERVIEADAPAPVWVPDPRSAQLIQPGDKGQSEMDQPRGVAEFRNGHKPLGLLAELTHRCPLGCPYCSNPLAFDARE